MGTFSQSVGAERQQEKTLERTKRCQRYGNQPFYGWAAFAPKTSARFDGLKSPALAMLKRDEKDAEAPYWISFPLYPAVKRLGW